MNGPDPPREDEINDNHLEYLIDVQEINLPNPDDDNLIHITIQEFINYFNLRKYKIYLLYYS